MSIDQKTMVSRHLPFQRSAQFGNLIPQSALGQLGQRLGIAFAFHEGPQDRPPRSAEHVAGYRTQLDVGILQRRTVALRYGLFEPCCGTEIVLRLERLLRQSAR